MLILTGYLDNQTISEVFQKWNTKALFLNANVCLVPESGLWHWVGWYKWTVSFFVAVRTIMKTTHALSPLKNWCW